MEPGHHPNVAAEFAKRRRAMWRAVLPWGALAALAFVVGFFVGNPGEDATQPERIIGTTAFFVLVAAFAISLWRMRCIYRCPSCEKPLMDAEGIHYAPDSCPKCGVKLSPPTHPHS
jgi:hypothetical protein